MTSQLPGLPSKSVFETAADLDTLLGAQSGSDSLTMGFSSRSSSQPSRGGGSIDAGRRGGRGM